MVKNDVNLEYIKIIFGSRGVKLKNGIELKGQVAEEIQMVHCFHCGKHHGESNLGRRGFVSVTLYNPSMGKSGYEQAQSLEVADSWLVSMVCSSCFRIAPRTTCPGVTLPP